ncbi:hypothetical protein AwDysgo_00180 [Bacteroidales bacterium]|nr:hypothetical protein AwDysgo_00180 [Bacteroidales bacterium]
MSNLIPMVVVGFLVLGVYRIFELYVRRKERIMMIEKIQEGLTFPSMDTLSADAFKPSLFPKTNQSFSTLKVALLMVGLSLGLIVAFVIQFAIAGNMLIASNFEYKVTRGFKELTEIIFFACPCFFGGLGLLAAYFIEREEEKKAYKS